MRHVRILAFGLAALAATASVGCWHSCGCKSPGTASGYYSPCCGTPGAMPAPGPAPIGIPTSSGFGAPCPTCPGH